MAKITRHGGPSDKTSPDFNPEAENATEEKLADQTEPIDLRDAETREDPEPADDPTKADGETPKQAVASDSGPRVTTVTSGSAEVKHEPVPEGSISEVTGWVGNDWVRAERALAKEREADTPRKSLISLLEKTITENKK